LTVHGKKKNPKGGEKRANRKTGASTKVKPP